MKRILSFLLTLALLAVFIPVSAGDGTVYSFGFDFDPIVEGWTFLDDGTWIQPDGKGKAKGEDGRTWVKVRLGMGEPKADGSYASYRSLGWILEEFVQA